MVEDHRLGRDRRVVAALAGAGREVGVLAVHEERLVEAVELLPDCPWRQAQAAGHDVDLALAVARPACQRLGVEQLRAAEDRREARREADEAPEALRAPARTGVELPVGTKRAPADETGLGVGACVPQQRSQRVSDELRVGVEQEHVLAGGGARTHVRAGCEADVLVQGDQADAGKLVADQLRAAVARGVLDDDDLIRASGDLALQRSQARPQQRGHLVRDDDDRDVRSHSGHHPITRRRPEDPP